ncbi:Smr/MutS family protein [Desulfobotulus mexicanus]|uniref:Smr/MutS family protein n=1 Tax=Desulfobotulus mexicanus TaxID=2586642 RepID=A0A5S5MDY9_9BACT|nr:Smr/MutS family protein [Desulfobotulus mexicanus]TYT73948.1 Smr/MutS family protein [Desulfobotulus mexicanus]
MSVFEGLQRLFSQIPAKDKNPEKKLTLQEKNNDTDTSFVSEKPAAPVCQKPVKKNRQGIPLIETPVEDLFKDMQHPESSPPTSGRLIQKRPLSGAEKKVFKKQKSGKNNPSRLNSKGLPILDQETDLLIQMEAARPYLSSKGEKLPSHIKKKVTMAAGKKTKPLLKDKNGIPLLKNHTDFTEVFTENIKETARTETKKSSPTPDVALWKDDAYDDFSKSLRSTLGNKTGNILLKEKKAGFPASAPITLKERLRRYPPPQENLDLHGFSGIQARLKTEIFLQQAKEKGTFTVRIIPGRGLHSDGPAVLPDIVDQKIREMEEEGLVLYWKWENEKKVPGGSVLVYIKHFDP